MDSDVLNTEQSQLIVYACPAGDLAKQIERFMAASREQFGPNTAHDYMPHVTLTGFFHDNPESIAGYMDAFDAAHRAQAFGSTPLRVKELKLKADFIGLALDGPGVQALMSDAVDRARSPTRRGAIRLKDKLHLSLAYGFEKRDAKGLSRLARSMVNPRADVIWELCLYQRHPDNTWALHAKWPLAKINTTS